MDLLAVEGVYKSFQGFMALSGVSLRVEAGSFHALVGPNGAGKTTLFNVITGRLAPDRGRVRFRGQEITGWPTHRVARLGVAISFQRAQPFASMEVLEAVVLARLGYGGATWNLVRPLWAYGGARAKAEAVLAKVGLEGYARRRVSELPLGDLKRLDVAMALVAEPRLLLLDEPLAGLSRAERRRMVEFMGELLRREGVTLLFTEHDTDAVLTLADRITVLHQGRVLAEGTPEEIRASKEVRAAFLGGER
ncbi:ABC transporter ATP-binding protein [Thermus oshimai]|uniref:ABC-type branched-chain amino acid transport systems, ATPase component n=1 Tax=Thermus oshimai JL-2 TaxID=751945 RepID=K7R8L9_THEOS|nr:ABC transporter ATP-binding protein [Thermus oshimai]AFV77439.1 ABC-type branched-chain amino acid transport systems, ATPase component [Thermus oshimai JL-2]